MTSQPTSCSRACAQAAHSPDDACGRRIGIARQWPGRRAHSKRLAGSLKSVLVVDDDAELRALVSDILKLLGCSVQTASNGYEALERIGAVQPDLILLDWKMPGMDGRQFGAAVREQPGGANLRIVLMSATPGAEQVSREIRAQACLRKPFSVDDLARLVHELQQWP